MIIPYVSGVYETAIQYFDGAIMAQQSTFIQLPSPSRQAIYNTIQLMRTELIRKGLRTLRPNDRNSTIYY